MRIGIDLLPLKPRVSGGIEFYIRNLLKAISKIDEENEYYIFTNLDNHNSFNIKNKNFHLHRVNIKAHPQVYRIMWEQIFLPIKASQLKLDLLHSPFYTYPIFCKIPGTVTICDMLYKVNPKSIGEPKLTYWKLFVPMSVKKCKKVITISEHSKKDIIKYFKINPQKVVVTPLALDLDMENVNKMDLKKNKIEEICLKYGIKEPYILNVGGIGKHKNPFSLIRVIKVLNERGIIGPLSLVITGNDYGIKRKIEIEIKKLGLEKYVYLPGYVERKDLPLLYTGAIIYASLSYFEGFGLTPLEAMAYGTPVVVSNCASLPEVVGDAAIIVDPDDIGKIEEAFLKIILDGSFRKELIYKGYKRVGEFSWDKTARLTIKTYQEVSKFDES